MNRRFRESWISKASGILLVVGLAYFMRNVGRFENQPKPERRPVVIPAADLIAAAERSLAQDPSKVTDVDPDSDDAEPPETQSPVIQTPAIQATPMEHN